MNSESTNTSIVALGQEWVTLQNNYEGYERSALAVKLIAILVWAIALAMDLSELLSIVVLAVLWLQEAILKTYQARLGVRILRIEAFLKNAGEPSAFAFQLHSEWLTARKGTGGLLLQYLVSAIKPTVAFPYVVLIALNAVMFIIWPR